MFCGLPAVSAGETFQRCRGVEIGVHVAVAVAREMLQPVLPNTVEPIVNIINRKRSQIPVVRSLSNCQQNLGHWRGTNELALFAVLPPGSTV